MEMEHHAVNEIKKNKYWNFNNNDDKNTIIKK